MPDGSARVPPQSLDAEAAVISAVFLAPELIHVVRPLLDPADFYADANRSIYAGILALQDSGQPLDVVLLANRLRADGGLDRVGGASYLAQLTDATPAIANVEAHARVIREKALQRRVIALTQRFTAEGYIDQAEPVTWAQRSAQELVGVASGLQTTSTKRIGEVLPGVITDLQEIGSGERIAGLKSGWPAYDRATNGWALGKMHVVGARPGMGKTSFALSAALNVAKRIQANRENAVVVFCSAEMDEGELTQRALAIEAFVSLESMRGGRCERDDWTKIAAANARLSSLPLVLDYKPGADLSHIRSVFQRELKGGSVRLALGVVDYLQILNGRRERGESREGEVARLSRGLMTMAGEIGAPLAVCSQLNRGLEARSNQNKRPTMADLRDSGSIEQDAYTVTLLYRDEYYNSQSEWSGTCETILGKNRGGKPGMVRLAFDAKSTAFRSLANEHEALGDFAEEAYP